MRNPGSPSLHAGGIVLAQGVEGGNEIQSAVVNVVKRASCASDEGVSVSSVTGQLKSKFSEAQVQYQASTLLFCHFPVHLGGLPPLTRLTGVLCP